LSRSRYEIEGKIESLIALRWNSNNGEIVPVKKLNYLILFFSKKFVKIELKNGSHVLFFEDVLIVP